MTDSNLPNKILAIDDDRTILDGLESQLSRHNIKVVKASDVDSALYLFNQQRFDVAVIELEFQPIGGLALVQKFRASPIEDRRSIGCIIACGKERGPQDDSLLKELEGLEYIEKPFNVIKLLPFLNRALVRRLDAQIFTQVRGVAYNLLKGSGDVNRMIATVTEQLPNEKQRVDLISNLLEESERFEDALKFVDHALSVDPKNIKNMNRKGRLLLKLGRPEEAQSFYETADQAAPGNIERIEAMSKLYLDLKKPEDCVAKMKELVRLNPEKKDIQFDMFSQLEKAGFRDEGIALIKDTTPPKEVVRYYNNKGVVFSKNSQVDMALCEYYTALMFYPKFRDNYRIFFNIALSEAGKKTPEGYTAAKEALKNCLLLAPDFEKAQSLLEQVEKKIAKAS